LTSDINGEIKTGDKITASPISGIGMKATISAQIVGTAETNFNSIKSVQQTVKRQDGTSAKVRIGLMPVQVNVSYFAVPQTQGSISAILPPYLQKIANALSGKQVSPLRVLIGALALILGFTAGAIMLYASVRSNIASIGRNPLAQEALRKGFVDVVYAAIGLLVITVGATYAILAT
jgi:hypothetical protein